MTGVVWWVGSCLMTVSLRARGGVPVADLRRVEPACGPSVHLVGWLAIHRVLCSLRAGWAVFHHLSESWDGRMRGGA